VLEVDEPRRRVHIDLDLLRSPAVWCDGRIIVSGVSWCVPNELSIGFA
jgi:hypothetical protein